MVERGQRYADNDPRLAGRSITVDSIEGDVLGRTFAICKTATGRVVRVNIKRMYTDDKARRTGFSLIKDTN